MSGPLIINQGSPNWWLSPDIWVTLPSDPSTPVVNPIAGTAYDVWVRVTNNYPLPVTDWNLFVCWAIPTVGPIPLPPAPQDLNGAPVGAPINVAAGYPGFSATFQTSMTWTPVFENGGHECLVAVTYVQNIGFPFTSLNGDLPPTGDYSIAQHNLGVLDVGPHMVGGRRFHYAFQVCNGAEEEHNVVVVARQAPLSEIAAFLPCGPKWRSVVDKPGKVEHLGIVASAKPDQAQLEAAKPVLSQVKLAPRSCRPFTLTGSLERGNALIHVTQSVDKRVVGGLSVLVMAEGK